MHIVILLQSLQKLPNLLPLGIRQFGMHFGNKADFAGDDGPSVGGGVRLAFLRSVFRKGGGSESLLQPLKILAGECPGGACEIACGPSAAREGR